MWGLFAGEARKQPPHMAPTTADPRETFLIQLVSGNVTISKVDFKILFK